jgi:hypothetical protein
MKENYKKFPLPKGKEWFRLPERVSALEGSQEPTVPYKVFTALLTQVGNNAPVATILQNTLEGEVSFHYLGEGNYVVVNSVGWDETKTTFQLEVGFGDFGGFVPSFVPITGGGKTILTFSNTGTAGSQPPNILPPSNGVLNKSLVEIKVYN